jgi:hypothetical protein
MGGEGREGKILLSNTGPNVRGNGVRKSEGKERTGG